MSTPLVIRFGALGDMILTTPLLRALAKRHGQPCAVACSGGWISQLYANLPYVGVVTALDSRGAPYWLSLSQQRLVRFMHHYRDSPCYLLEGDDKSHWLADRAQLTLTAYNRQLADHSNLHQVDVHARIAGFYDEAGQAFSNGFEAVPEIIITQAERSACKTWLETLVPAGAPVVLVHPGNKKTMGWRQRSNNLKDWPQAHWVATIQAVLASLPDAQVLLTGSTGELPMTRAIAQACASPRVRTIAGATSLRRLFSLLSMAHSVISVDTGPAHAAGAMGCPVVVLFGQTDPRANRPLSRFSPVLVVTGPPGAPELRGEAAWREHHRMSGIAPEMVIAAWRSLLVR